MSAQPHFATRIDDLDLRFTRERGSGNDPSPLLIIHCWPCSWHSCHGMIGLLAHPERHGDRIEDAFDVVIPSYPGYDVSGRPRRPMGSRAIALVFDGLMARLGYDRYAW